MTDENSGPCKDCGGTGEIFELHDNLPASRPPATANKICPRCSGTGRASLSETAIGPVLYKVWLKRSDGAMIPFGSYESKEAAVAEAQEPILVKPEPGTFVVTDIEGTEIFSAASDGA